MDDEGPEGVILVSLLAGRYTDIGDDTDIRRDSVGSDRAQNERDNGPVTEPRVSKQDLRKVQNCRNEL